MKVRKKRPFVVSTYNEYDRNITEYSRIVLKYVILLHYLADILQCVMENMTWQRSPNLPMYRLMLECL